MDSDTSVDAETPGEDFEWDPETERLHQIKVALAMTPAQRLRWLETTVAELQAWVGRARPGQGGSSRCHQNREGGRRRPG